MEVEKEHAEGIENKGTQDNRTDYRSLYYQMGLGNDNDDGNGVIVTLLRSGHENATSNLC